VRLLVVEDQSTLAKTFRHTLVAEGFGVDVSPTAADAEHKTQNLTYDLILLSLLLPGESGYKLLRELRRGGVASPILAMIGNGSIPERVRCLDLGADGYISRPIHLMELTARVRAMLRRTHQVYEPILRIFDLEIDTTTRMVKRAGKEIRLTRREYTLLQFLAMNRGKVCSRALISEHLYDPEEECTSNVVDVFIRFLRGKIDKGFGFPLILTRWGQGYVLRDETPVKK